MAKQPKSQEREKKSSGSELEDVDDGNMDEFVVNENYNIQKLKNPSLITSIAINSSKPLDQTGVNLAQYSNTFIRSNNFSNSSSLL